MRYLWLLLLCASCSVGTVKLLPGRAAVQSPKAQISLAPRIVSAQSMAQPDLAITTPSVILLPAGVWLEWQPSPDDGVAGYNIYYGLAPHQYQWMTPAYTNLTIEITNIDIGREYWFAATCYDFYGTESDFSDELDLVIPQKLGLFFDQPGDTLWASYNLIDWFPRQARLTNNMWRVEMQSGVNLEFYRTSTTYATPSAGPSTN